MAVPKDKANEMYVNGDKVDIVWTDVPFSTPKFVTGKCILQAHNINLDTS